MSTVLRLAAPAVVALAIPAVHARLPIQTSVASYTRQWLIRDVATTMPRSAFSVRCTRKTYLFECVAIRHEDNFLFRGVRIWRKTRCIYVVTFLSAHLEPTRTKQQSMC